MIHKTSLYAIALVIASSVSFAVHAKEWTSEAVTVKSPNGKAVITLSAIEGQLHVSAFLDETPVLRSSPVVMSVAQGGDLRANSLLTLAVEELVLHVRTLARQLFGDERASIPLALGGGLLSKGSLLRKRLVQRLSRGWNSRLPRSRARAGAASAPRTG